MIRAVIFDMFETLVSLFACERKYRYGGRQIAADAGIDIPRFYEIWHATEDERTCGKLTFEEVIERILKVNGCYSGEMMKKISEKRRTGIRCAFDNPHPQIIPMMEELKENGIKIALITNCYFEEREVMRDTALFKYFDVACLSCECGIMKPDRRIFDQCLERLGVLPGECLYIGDGGSRELETAEEAGMHPLQAAWYLEKDAGQPVGVLEAYEQLEAPMDTVKKVLSLNRM
ncbi:MAG: haloacid dehalogenase superfamily enzyme, subfamily IA [Clostridiales bacterium]|nr:haloacid dehalogenase superfamily enzyme, subfamily IA [Clostridiales bacterium]